MKIQIDTILKIIRIEDSVCLGELIDSLDRLLPNSKWREFKLETIIKYWNIYQIITYPVWPAYPTYPVQPWITWCDTTAGSYTLNNGVYNVSLNP